MIITQKNQKKSKSQKNQKKSKSFKTHKSIYKDESNYDPNIDFFQTNSRLNPSQRKYCHCLMSVRKNKKKTSPYGICIGIMKKKKLIDYKLKSSKYSYKKKPLKINPKITNCLMNYDLYKYDINQIRDLATEKKLPIYYIKNNKNKKTKKKKIYLTKRTLISKIINNYLSKKQNK